MGSQSSGSWKDTTARVSILASKRLCFRYLLTTTIFVFVFILHQYLFPSAFYFSKLRDVVFKISAATVPTSGSSGPLNLTVELPVDHFNPQDTRTFKNRYWLNDTFYEKGGPVFLYDAGEAGVPSSAAQCLLNNDQIVFAPLELAKKYHGRAIVWEHRFYGESLPFALKITTGLAAEGYDAYKYLNNEQALEDVVCFANHFQPPGHEKDILTSDSTPWIWIGGSYPGIRAAIIRQRNPDVFLASWSSSGPVKTQVDGSVYYNPIQQALPSNCSADIHAAITYADNVLLEGSPDEIDILERAIYYSKILNPKGNSSLPNYPEYPCDLNYWEIASILSYPFQGSFLSFQSFGYQLALSKFCDTIETWNPSNATNFTFSSNSSDLEINSLNALPTSAGVSATYSPKYAFYAYMYASIEKCKADFAFFPGRSRSMPDTVSLT